MSFTSKHKGIYYRKERNKWVARVMIKGKQFQLGHYNTEQEAIDAYNEQVPKLMEKMGVTSLYINQKKRKIFDRDENGLITRVCEDCGKIDKYDHAPPNDHRCQSCSAIRSNAERPQQQNFKDIPINQIIERYYAGESCPSLAIEYGVSQVVLIKKMVRNGCIIRPRSENLALKDNIAKAQKKISELYKIGEFQKIQSARMQGIPIEEWKGFVSNENVRFYRSPEYKQLRKDVLKRDNYQCRACNKINVKFEVHHIKPKAKFDHLKLDPNNCITLCEDCHHATIGKEDQVESLLLSLVYNI